MAGKSVYLGRHSFCSVSWCNRGLGLMHVVRLCCA